LKFFEVTSTTLEANAPAIQAEVNKKVRPRMVVVNWKDTWRYCDL
jgi:hypothetical protein